MTPSCSPTLSEYAQWTTARNGPSGPFSNDRRPIAVRGAPGHNGRVGSRGRMAVLAACLVLLAPVATSGAAPSLGGQLQRALATPSAGPWISAGLVIDLSTGATLFARDADNSLEPASNEKLAVTYAALTELGPAYRFKTEVLGEGYRDGDIWYGNLVLKGFGDPSLTSHRLALLADELRKDGITRVTG